MYTVGQAAKATGKSKSTISVRIKKRTIPAKKNEDRSYSIDPAELHRVFPPVVSDNGSSEASLVARNRYLHGEIQLLHEQLTNKDRVIDNLRRKLAEVEEQRKLAGLVFDWRQLQPEPEPIPPPRKGLRGFLRSLLDWCGLSL